MSTALLVIVAVLAVARFAPGSAALRDARWYRGWAGWLGDRVQADAEERALAMLVVAALVLPAVVAVAVLDGLLAGGFWDTVLAFLVLAWAWGPRDLDRDVATAVEASDPPSRHAALLRLYPRVSTVPGAGVDAVFHAALARWFGVLLWFLLLGPAGALGYRLVALTADVAMRARLPGAVVDAAALLLRVLDWPAAQLMTLALALAGNFDAVVGAWRDWHSDGPGLDRGFLYAAARGCVRVELADAERDRNDALVVEVDGDADAAPGFAAGTAELRDAMSLVWRILLLWLAFVALVVISGWVL